jgi:hypothetical protein
LQSQLTHPQSSNSVERHLSITTSEGKIMSLNQHLVTEKDADDEPIPFMQQLLDNPFILLFLGVMVPMLVYTLWGVIDILTVPLAR